MIWLLKLEATSYYRLDINLGQPVIDRKFNWPKILHPTTSLVNYFSLRNKLTHVILPGAWVLEITVTSCPARFKVSTKALPINPVPPPGRNNVHVIYALQYLNNHVFYMYQYINFNTNWPIFRFNKIHTWLRGLGEENNRNHLKAQQRIIHFFCFIPQALQPSMNFNISELVYYKCYM